MRDRGADHAARMRRTLRFRPGPADLQRLKSMNSKQATAAASEN